MRKLSCAFAVILCLCFLSANAVAQLSKVQHVVIIVQENRSTDNLFGSCPSCLPNADIATSGVNSHGKTIPLRGLPLKTNFDLQHGHTAFTSMFEDGKMTGADEIQCIPLGTHSCPSNPWFTYVQQQDVQPYFDMARQYVFADRMFASQRGPSFPAHLYLLGDAHASDTSSDFISSNYTFDRMPKPGAVGCIGDPRNIGVALLNTMDIEYTNVFPCFSKSTLIDFFRASGISFYYYDTSGYQEGPANLWLPQIAIEQLCRPSSDGKTCTAPDWKSTVQQTKGTTQIFNDIANGRLAQVVWVTPTAESSDHPRSNDGSGPSWVASVVNAIGTSPYWDNTIILVTWDDWGGFYDHVAPSTRNQFEYGFRVPLIVIGPYAKQGYVSHTMFDFGSIQKLLEDWLGLPRLGGVDTVAGDLNECFDWTQAPRIFVPIPSRKTKAYFMRHIPKDGPVDDD